MKGRKPIPTPIRRLTGNPQHHALPENEPIPPPGRPTCPMWLDRAGRTEWHRVVPLLDGMGVLSTLDRGMIAAYCAAWSQFIAATRTLQAEGMVIETGRGMTTHPAANLQIKLAATLRAYCVEFGMTPSARSRMQLPGQVEAKDDFDRLMEG